MASRRGFTLIELVTVMLILGILGAVAAPRYVDAMAAYRVDLAAGRVAADLRLLRQHAARTSAVQSLTFSATTNDYASATMTHPDNPSLFYSVNLWSSEYATDVTAVSFAGGLVQFDIYGRPSNVGSVSLQSGTRTRTVSIDANGKVSVL